MTETEVTAIIPVFNDRKSLEIAIPSSIKSLSEITQAFEILIAEDGSSDGSAELVTEYKKQDGRVSLIHSDERQGRGRALNRAIREARGSIVCYYDVDLATDMHHLKELIDAAELAHQFGLQVNAGHGLHYQNVTAIAAIPHMNELNIGHAIIARAIFMGLEPAVREMKRLMLEAR